MNKRVKRQLVQKIFAIDFFIKDIYPEKKIYSYTSKEKDKPLEKWGQIAL